MSTLMRMVVQNYNEILEPKRDPLVDSWLFMSSPIPVVFICILYLYFVLKLGPQWMEKRKPFEMKKILVGYNFYQVLFNIWLCHHAVTVKKSILDIIQNSCSDNASPRDLQEQLAGAAWWYFFSKIVELLDTVFFVLRKKQSQVTFLHVYHHCSVTFFSWGYLKFLPGEQGILIGLLNALVHVIMYTYYMLAAMGPKFQKYLWWKKYMTWIQMTQFCLMLSYLAYIIAIDCKLSKGLTFFFVANATIFLYLFANFYRTAYKKPKNSIKGKTETAKCQ